MEECIFCKIIKGEIPCYKIYEDKYTLAFLDIANDIEGHTLVIPKKHCKNILDCSQEELARVFTTVKKVAKYYVDDCGYDGVNILNCNNSEAGQTVFHFHIHIYPRKSKDGVEFFPKSHSDCDMAKVCKKLRLTK